MATATMTAAPVLAVALDHAHARFFLVTDDLVTEIECLDSPRMRGGRFHSDRQGSPGWGEGGFHGRRQEEERRHYSAVARRLAALTRAHSAQEIVLGGSVAVVAALTRALPRPLAGQVVGTVDLNPVQLTIARVRRAVQAAHRGHTVDVQAEWVKTFQEAFGTQQAVDGLRGVLGALADDQVRTLLVAPRPAHGGYRCGRSGRLVLSKADAEGEPVVRVPDVVAAAIDEALRRGGAVVAITEPELATRIDGVAALLRHR